MVKEMVGPDLGRRRFVNWLLGASAGTFLLSVLYPMIRYLIPPPGEEAVAGTVTLQIKPQNVKPNTGQIFKFGNRPGILLRTPAGEPRACGLSGVVFYN